MSSDDETSSVSSEDSTMMDDISRPEVMTKYRLAGDFAQYALDAVIAACEPGAKVFDLCSLGDEKILEKTKSVYTKAVVVKGEKVKIEKGIAFPTSVSVNHVLGNFSPRAVDAEVVLEEGNIAKIELGVHIDGYIATATHTVIVGKATPSGRQADAIVAAEKALEACMRLLKPGNKSTQITEMARKIGEEYGVSPVEGIKCCTMKRFVIEAKKQVPINHRPEDKPDVFDIELNDVYAIEVAYSTGDGKCSDKTGMATIFRRAVDVTYMLKLKASRQLFSEINTQAPSLPFGMRAMEAKLGSAAKLGLKEILANDLLHAYPVLTERSGETIATFKCTCLVMPSGVIKLTNFPYPSVDSEKQIQDKAINDLLATALKKSKKKKKAAK